MRGDMSKLGAVKVSVNEDGSAKELEEVVYHTPKSSTYTVKYKNINLEVSIDHRNGKLSIAPTHGSSRDGFVFHGSKPEMVADIAKCLYYAATRLK